MSDLRSELQRITVDFVSAVLGAMRSASLSDLANQAGRAASAPAAASPARRPGRQPQARTVAPRAQAAAQPVAKAGRRHRASAEEVQKQKDLALATAKQLPAGFSKGDVMKKSGSKIDLGRALTLLVNDGKLTKKGDRRNTRYWVK